MINTPTFTQLAGVQLAQSRPSGTSAESFISSLDKSKFIVYTIIITNTTGSAANASLFHDANGTTYDQTTALLYAKQIAANDYLVLNLRDGVFMEDGSNIGIQTGTGSALTFTAYGVELAGSGVGF